MVGFAVCLDASKLEPPSRAQAAMKRIHAMCQSTPTSAVDHTDFLPLHNLPMFISIESKRHGESSDKAELQLGVWLSAQWKFLASMFGSGPNSHAGGSLGTERQQKSLEVMPSILVRGHSWRLMISTLKEDGMRRVIYKGVEFGTTQTAVGVYKLSFGLQWMAGWIENTN
ncbi:hypothetical protein MKZ38_002741 [Zalerion maritima]|uniref:PD-(D/E)XK nuclease-like domain-containing protein n=1 Tax=Zalerion maritima TaxID=339359 RepID=A0AAD5RNH7_9PEZI|nr:hypothetical protein MKZ38_002741 [Zalerion maritima]